MELKRRSGVLLALTSLPSIFGIGDMGEEAFRFADILHGAGQGLWQILPPGPTSTSFGNSPYSALSAFALNPLLISPGLLVRQGFLDEEDIEGRPSFPSGSVDYGAVTGWKAEILLRAFGKSKRRNLHANAIERFCETQSAWLDDFALFSALRKETGCSTWTEWPAPLRDRDPGALADARSRLARSIERRKFLQYLCFTQWAGLKDYCSGRGITVIGDVPLYVNLESADVWAHRRFFRLNERGLPISVSGVPPDYFSETGQLWNNPIFDWARLKEENYSWWVDRVAHNLELFDCVRIDHFRGIAEYWEVPFGAETAESGTWNRGPGEDFLSVLRERFPSLPFIAEDLGVINDEVAGLRDRFGLPGMRVFQFGFGSGGSELHRPHRYTENCVAYTGTHDNETLAGRLGSSGRTRREVRRYLGCRVCGKRRLQRAVIRALMHSKAGWVVVPLQDILELGPEARMNTPGTALHNWEWRLTEKRINALRGKMNFLIDVNRADNGEK